MVEISPAESRWLNAYAISIPVAYAALLAAFFGRVGGIDHDQFLVFHELQYWNARLFGLSKQWAPVMCGGISMAADPQVPFASFSMVLSYLLGPFYGLRAATVGYFCVGWLGAFLYAGLWLKTRMTKALAASLFIGNGFFIARLANGHSDHIAFLALPAMLWALHRSRHLAAVLGGRVAGSVLLSLLLGGVIALVVDGSPVAVVHWLLWVGVYVLALACVERSTRVVWLTAGAAATALLLDAGYLWPMLAGQQEFPRGTADTFTNPLALLWFLIVPSTGMVVPAPILGHELTVWAGPVVCWTIVRYRRAIGSVVPRVVWIPWIVTGAVSVLLGMGSLTSVGAPRFLSAFDLLRPLPGFRSIGVTGRYWGFLALPLAMAGAMALVSLVRERPGSRWVQAGLLTGMLLQVGFQLGAVVPVLSRSRAYEPVPLANQFEATFAAGRAGDTGEQIEYVDATGRLQGALITPTRGVIDCYDGGDFVRPHMRPGRELVQEVLLDDRPVDPEAFRARFLTWNRITLTPREGLPAGRWRVVLNQAFNRHWSSSAGLVFGTASGNLGVERRQDAMPPAPLLLDFDDRVSRAGARVSTVSWAALLTVLGVGWLRRRAAGFQYN